MDRIPDVSMTVICQDATFLQLIATVLPDGKRARDRDQQTKAEGLRSCQNVDMQPTIKASEFDGNLSEFLNQYGYQRNLTEKLDTLHDVRFTQELVNEIVLWKVDRFVQLDDNLLRRIESVRELNQPQQNHLEHISNLPTRRTNRPTGVHWMPTVVRSNGSRSNLGRIESIQQVYSRESESVLTTAPASPHYFPGTNRRPGHTTRPSEPTEATDRANKLPSMGAAVRCKRKA